MDPGVGGAVTAVTSGSGVNKGPHHTPLQSRHALELSSHHGARPPITAPPLTRHSGGPGEGRPSSLGHPHNGKRHSATSEGVVVSGDPSVETVLGRGDTVAAAVEFLDECGALVALRAASSRAR